MSSVIPVGAILPGFLEIDELALLFVFAASALSILSLLCAPATRLAFHHSVLTLLFLIVMVGVVAAANALVFYVCWELAALFAWGLGRLNADPRSTGVAPFNAAGALASFLMFVGLVVQAAESRSLLLETFRGSGGTTGLLVLLAILLKSFGLLSEGWERTERNRFSLTNPILVGPSLLVVGFHPYLRFFGWSGGEAAEWWPQAAWGLGILAIVSALAALAQLDTRRILTYGALSQFTSILFALAVSHDTKMITGSLLGIVGYAMAMTGIAICLALAEEAAGERLLSRMGGLAQRAPVTAVLFLLCALALVGMPPFQNFVGMGLVGLSFWGGPDIRLALMWSVLPILTIAYLGRLFVGIYLGEVHPVSIREPRRAAITAIVVLVAALFVAGITPDGLTAWINPAVAQLGAT